MEKDYGSHCRKTGCQCSHDTCFRGWRDNDRGTTIPCNVCRAAMHSRWTRSMEARHKGYPVEAVQRILRGE